MQGNKGKETTYGCKVLPSLFCMKYNINKYTEKVRYYNPQINHLKIQRNTAKNTIDIIKCQKLNLTKSKEQGETKTNKNEDKQKTNNKIICLNSTISH